VYPDDAGDIKSHPFFKSIRWDELHLRKPPFVPKIKSWEDTKYFDEEPISDLDDTSSETSPQNLPDTSSKDCNNLNTYHTHAAGAESGLHDIEEPQKDVKAKQNEGPAIVSKPPGTIYKRKKEKKRPRDKILRDEEVAKQALDIRKRRAFLGYTYRRPKDVLFEFENDRGRPLMMQRERHIW